MVTVKIKQKLILVVTNDSTVFLSKGVSSVYEMFGGRVTEVKNLVSRLDAIGKNDEKSCVISFGIISSHFGFVPENYVIAPYQKVMDCKEDYIAVQEKKDYLGQLRYLSLPFDKVILCVPKDMFRMFLDDETFQHGKVITVTSLEFKEKCEERGWTFLERKGARVGNDNADKIFEMIENIC